MPTSQISVHLSTDMNEYVVPYKKIADGTADYQERKSYFMWWFFNYLKDQYSDRDLDAMFLNTFLDFYAPECWAIWRELIKREGEEEVELWVGRLLDIWEDK